MPIKGYHLATRSVLRLNGSDRIVFLQGLISNDVALCAPGQPVFAALLTPQGKYLFDLFVHDAGEYYLIEGEAARIGELVQKLTAYRLRAKVTVEEAADLCVLAFPESGPAPFDPRLASLGARGIFARTTLGDYDLKPEADYHHTRMLAGVPEGGGDMEVGQSTLSEGNFDFLNGISWKKGCYVGQELTARMYHRGLTKRRLLPVSFTEKLTPGELLFHRNQEIGEIRSVGDRVALTLMHVAQAQIARTSGEKIMTKSGNTVSLIWPDWLKL